MHELSKSQRARLAIRTFKTIADALILQGAYKPSGKAGQKLGEALIQLSPEIYGSMADPRIVELKGLEYVLDRMPRGIENCNRIILTAQEDFEGTSFEQIIPLKRRRVSYAVSEKEICFVITTGKSEIYDILTHITFLSIEANKIARHICRKSQGFCAEWLQLEKVIELEEQLHGEDLDQAIWNLSILLGRTYKETRSTYEYLEGGRRSGQGNNGLFQVVYGIGRRMIEEQQASNQELTVYFTPSLHEMIDLQKYASLWAQGLKENLCRLGLEKRTIHVISANMHSMRNLLYGAGAIQAAGEQVPDDLYDMVRILRSREEEVIRYAGSHGFAEIDDTSASNIDIHLMDLAEIPQEDLHPQLRLVSANFKDTRPVLAVFDYAFGTQAFDIMDALLTPSEIDGEMLSLKIGSISVMGKAGILPGKKGDIMIATAHVEEGTANNYMVNNDLTPDDFYGDVSVFVGPMVTVLGTSLQNRDMLARFHSSSWQAIGLEMEGGHYQRAISAAIIQGHIPTGMKTRYAYYASDNPMVSGQTLASGPMGEEGVVPTYLISKILLEKISDDESRD